uniref:Uncharacterized protein n=1 Tax=Trichobilharzia regenti TaxID=157069 RepID=A0AA85KG74_TRIRE|nr:unnamed protein product [Trichobilharzia regenti]
MKNKQIVSATLSAYQISNLLKFLIISSIFSVEMVIVTVLLHYFDFKMVIREKYWLTYVLIGCSVLSSLLIAFVHGLRAKFPANYIILFLNTLLLCYAFIPPILEIEITYILVSYFISGVILYTSILLGTRIKKKFFYRWFVYLLVSWVVASCLTSIILYYLQLKEVLYHFMGAVFIPFLIALLLRIGQLLVMEHSERMFGSHFILGSLALTFIFLMLFYSVAIHFCSFKNSSDKKDSLFSFLLSDSIPLF